MEHGEGDGRGIAQAEPRVLAHHEMCCVVDNFSKLLLLILTRSTHDQLDWLTSVQRPVHYVLATVILPPQQYRLGAAHSTQPSPYSTPTPMNWSRHSFSTVLHAAQEPSNGLGLGQGSPVPAYPRPVLPDVGLDVDPSQRRARARVPDRIVTDRPQVHGCELMCRTVHCQRWCWCDRRALRCRRRHQQMVTASSHARCSRDWVAVQQPRAPI